MFIKKPEQIYRKELPKVGLPFSPGGYAGDDVKLNFFQMIFKGLLREEMAPKYHRRFDAIMLDFKCGLITFILVYCVSVAAFSSAAMSGKVTDNNAEDNADTYFNRALEWTIDECKDVVIKIRNL